MTERDQDLWADWVTIWQSEMAALAADREMQEFLQRAIDAWAAHNLAFPPGNRDEPAGGAGPIPPPGSAPAPAPPLGVDSDFGRWLARVAASSR